MTETYPYECKTLIELTENKQEYLGLEKLENDFFNQETLDTSRAPFFYTRISYEMDPFDETYNSLRIYQTRPVCFLDEQDQNQNQEF
jgi:hypothetical protein